MKYFPIFYVGLFLFTVLKYTDTQADGQVTIYILEVAIHDRYVHMTNKLVFISHNYCGILIQMHT